jgi:maleate isomerase
MAITSERTPESFHSTPVQAAFKLDSGPGRHRIGLIVLSNDYAMERDFMNMRPNDDVAVFVSRVPNTTECNVETLHKMSPHITTAASLLVPEGRLDAVAYGCTSGTVVMGYDTICARIHAAREGVVCTTPITASLAALNGFGAQKLAVLTPYVDSLNAAISGHLEEHGKTIAGFTSFHIEDNEEMACVPAEAIYQAALEADRPDADALFIFCTAIRAVDVIEHIEQTIGKPVVSANQALFWQSLRAAGYQAPVAGYGSLLRSTMEHAI